MSSEKPPELKLPEPPQWLAFLATPEGAKTAQPAVRAYMALFNRFPKVTCFLSGMAVMAAIEMRQSTQAQ